MTTSSKQRSADVTPHAAALIEGLRDIGYSVETAVADIIDNSITAGANRVEIRTQTHTESPYIAIIDDGAGMTEAELISAMRPGSTNPLETRDGPDLGRFGLGLKSASFSQCRRLTVVSRKNNKTSAAIWDLDVVAQRNLWEVLLPERPEEVPEYEQLGASGTLVLWENLDRLGASYQKNVEKRAEVINRRIAETERHLRLVFHRFMEKRLKLAINGRELRALDPFAIRNQATIADPSETVAVRDGVVTIQSFTLPHHKDMKKSEWDDLGGPEGHVKSQGFYLYRGNRLILYGTWFGLARQEELTKLSRVKIDIPNSMDSDWKIDVKKSSAQLPPVVRDRLKAVIERIRAGSKRTYQHKGQKLVAPERMPVWQRVQAHGEINYRPDPQHPVLEKFAADLSDEMRQRFWGCVSLIGAALPIDTLHADMAGAAESIRPTSLHPADLAQAVTLMHRSLSEMGRTEAQIEQILRDAEPFKSNWAATREILASVVAETEN